MNASQIIEHHNFMWQNLLIPDPVQLLRTRQVLDGL